MPSYAQVSTEPDAKRLGDTGEQSQGGKTALQSHTAFFDRDGDGIIWPSDTYKGFRKLGYGIFLALFATFVINGAFSWFTMDQWFPDPFFRLKVNRMHKAKHGSDSETYDHKGRFDDRRFEDIFATYTDPPHDAITYVQTLRMVRQNAHPFDLFGWTAEFLEWSATYLLLWPADGRMKKADVKGVYDGSIFWTIEERHAKPQKTT